MKWLFTSLLVSLLAAASVRGAQDAAASGPQAGHAWLQQLVGEWETDIEVPPESGRPARSVKAIERIRAIGNLWIVAEGEVADPSETVRSLQTLGYDPEKGKFVGTWIDSTSSFLWTYEGTLDEKGKTLTLEAEGPGEPGGMSEPSRYKDVIELTDEARKTLTSWVQGEDGQWTTFAKATYRRIR